MSGKPAHRELSRANERARAGAGISESEVLDAMNRWHLAVLEQQLGGGHINVHLGLARHGRGKPFCVAEYKERIVAREALGAFRSPYFSMRLPEQQRWWCGIVWLEQNRGCQTCIERAYRFADEQGWRQPRRLGDLLGIATGPSASSSGPRLTSRGFERGAA